MKKITWLERQFASGLPAGMLPFYLERLEGSMIRLDSKVKGLSDKILSEKMDDKWSIKQNIAHLAEIEEIALKRIDEIMQGISPMSSAIFALKNDYNTQPIDAVLSYFNNTKTIVIKRFRSLGDDELQKAALHPRLKIMMSAVDLAFFHAEHDDHHFVRINEIISALS